MKEIKKFQIGKNGLTGSFIEQVKNAFKNSNMIKISILKSACRDKKEAKEMKEKLINELGGHFTCRLLGYVLIVQKWRKNRK